MTVWRCDVTGNQVGTDTVMIGAPPCACQGCRAADLLTELKAMVETFDGYQGMELKRAKAAIAKAELS